MIKCGKFHCKNEAVWRIETKVYIAYFCNDHFDYYMNDIKHTTEKPTPHPIVKLIGKLPKEKIIFN